MGFTNGCQVMERESGADPAILIVPGWSGSGPSHWQTIWEREHPEYRRVEQRNWHNVYRPEWGAGLEQAVLSVSGDVVLVAHSLGCLAVAWWAATRGCAWRRVEGAMLVAPPTVQIGNARMYVHHGVHRAEHVLARMLFIIDEGLRQLTLIPVGTVYDNLRLVRHAIQPVNSGLHGDPL